MTLQNPDAPDAVLNNLQAPSYIPLGDSSEGKCHFKHGSRGRDHPVLGKDPAVRQRESPPFLSNESIFYFVEIRVK